MSDKEHVETAQAVVAPFLTLEGPEAEMLRDRLYRQAVSNGVTEEKLLRKGVQIQPEGTSMVMLHALLDVLTEGDPLIRLKVILRFQENLGNFLANVANQADRAVLTSGVDQMASGLPKLHSV